MADEVENSLADITILYAEDEPDIRESLNRFLKRRVKKVILAEDGDRAIRLYHDLKPDILITDIKMPGLDGLELTRRIKALDPQLPVIITTAHNDEKFLLEAINVGVDAYLKKPIDNVSLTATLEKFTKISLLNRQLQEKNELIQLVLDKNPNFVLIIESGKILYMNRSLLDFLEYANLEHFNRSKANLDDYIFIREEEQKVPFSGFFPNIVVSGVNEMNVKIVNPRHLEQPESDYSMKVFKAPNHRAHLVFFNDISNIEKERARYQVLALTDPLTKVYNRLKFDDAIDFEIERAKRYERPLAIIMFDLDHFKSVNDQHGHQVGDYVLQEVARLVKINIRQTDIFARYGGEEFVILSPETTLEGAKEIAEKLRVLIERHEFRHIGSLTCSFGVVQFELSDTASSLIYRVDMALYKAKNGGRNKVETA